MLREVICYVCGQGQGEREINDPTSSSAKVEIQCDGCHKRVIYWRRMLLDRRERFPYLQEFASQFPQAVQPHLYKQPSVFARTRSFPYTTVQAIGGIKPPCSDCSRPIDDFVPNLRTMEDPPKLCQNCRSAVNRLGG